MTVRRKSLASDVGGVPIGGNNPIVVQSMTNTETSDVESTVEQILELSRAGSELVRVTVNTEAAAQAVPRIVDQLEARGLRVPIVGDFHYNGHLLLSRFPECAASLAKYRINPGNVGMGRHWDRNFAQMIELALKYSKAVRIGVNWGSVDQKLLARLMDENSSRREPWSASCVLREALVVSCLDSARTAVELGMSPNQIILSAKVSSVPELIEVYRALAARCSYALHLGLTEAGMGTRGIVASSAALGVLLADGIGDTIRVSLTPEPGGDRSLEVLVARQILQAMGLRHFSPQVTACPGCGRTTSTYFQELAGRIDAHLREALDSWKRAYPGVEGLKVAVMGCIVNGPGESKHADIGISLPGTGEEPKAPVYIDGKHFVTLKGERVADQFIAILGDYVARRFG